MIQKSFRIKDPCNEKWGIMSVSGCGRYCGKCHRNVIDLTKKTDEEIVDFVMRTPGRVCGRISHEQIKKIIHQNKSKTGFIRTFFLFLFGFSVLPQRTDAKTPLEGVSIEMKETNFYMAETILFNVPRHLTNTLRFKGVILGEDDNEPLPNATVKIKGTPFETTTNHNGTFELAVEEDKLVPKKIVLVVSFIGYESQEVEGLGLTEEGLTIRLIPDVGTIGEVTISWLKRIWWTIKSPFQGKKKYA